MPDLADALGVQESRFELSAQGPAAEGGEEAAAAAVDSSGMSLELQAANGACDLQITIYHGESDAVAEDEMPAALLAQCQRELPFGTMLMRRLYKAVHILPGRSLEFRVREAVEPELERINVRRVLGEKLDELKAEQTACYEQEIAAKREKVAQADSLLPADGCAASL